MFLPIGTERPLKRPTLINHLVIGACVFVYFAQTISWRNDSGAWIDACMLRPDDIVWWNFITYQFLHGGFMHLLGNMLFLWVFGPNIEDRLGRFGYVGLYLIGGVAAGAAHVAFDEAWVLGASGSIAAVTGAYIVFFPRTHIRVLIFFFFIGVYSIPSVIFIGIAIARDLFGVGIGGANSGVAHLAHLGGYGFGFAVSMLLLALKFTPRETYDLFTMGRQAKRRRDFKAAAAAGHSPWAHEAPARVRKTAKDRPNAASEKIAEDRAAIASAVRAGDRDTALRLYANFAAQNPEGALTRAVQLEIAGWLFERAEHAQADDAYERYLRQNASDSEADRVRLMSALIRARYTKKREDAVARLGEINADRLSADERDLYDALRAETNQ